MGIIASAIAARSDCSVVLKVTNPVMVSTCACRSLAWAWAEEAAEEAVVTWLCSEAFCAVALLRELEALFSAACVLESWLLSVAIVLEALLSCAVVSARADWVDASSLDSDELLLLLLPITLL